MRLSSVAALQSDREQFLFRMQKFITHTKCNGVKKHLSAYLICYKRLTRMVYIAEKFAPF
jgi:hypothetical protein